MLHFKNLDEHHLEKILQMRTTPDITRCLFTDIENPSMEGQLGWYKALSKSGDNHFWAMFSDDDIIGALFIEHADLSNKRVSWGYYIGSPKHKKIGGLIPAMFYNHLFFDLGFEKAQATVFAWLSNVLKIHEMYGCHFVGTMQHHILKNGAWHDVVLLEMTKDSWKEKTKWHSAKACFEECPLTSIGG